MIYLDNAATTKPYKEVIDTMYGIMTHRWANPSGNNSEADKARQLIENIRQQFADDLNCSPEEIIFTGSGCEANTMAIKGFLDRAYGYNFYYSKLEHASINELIDSIPSRIYKIRIPNDQYGIISPEALEEKILKHQAYYGERPFVTIAAANSEIGVIQDIKALAKITHKYGGILHCDAVQLFPERQIDVKDYGVDLLSISAQKFHGPRGVGVLYVRKGIKLNPIIYGTQESHLRGGSYNTPAICGMGKALELTRARMPELLVSMLRNNLLYHLLQIPGTHLNGVGIGPQRLTNNISLTIDGVNSEKLMTLCDLSGVIIAKGSACQSYIESVSSTLKAIGLTNEQALNTIRITLDDNNTWDEIEAAKEIITRLVERIRNEQN